jgi:hypothetical protein
MTAVPPIGPLHTQLHMTLMKANVNVYAATGVADGGGSFGYVIYVRPEQYSLAVAALGL